MRTLNLGILAHVDAGKTTLTERLLYTAGAITKIGSVDQGTTQTDTLELERERGITIKSAVASFAIDDLTVNILDTPGHPDFIAEVERVLRVLDGAILVISGGGGRPAADAAAVPGPGAAPRPDDPVPQQARPARCRPRADARTDREATDAGRGAGSARDRRGHVQACPSSHRTRPMTPIGAWSSSDWPSTTRRSSPPTSRPAPCPGLACDAPSASSRGPAGSIRCSSARRSAARAWPTSSDRSRSCFRRQPATPTPSSAGASSRSSDRRPATGSRSRGCLTAPSTPATGSRTATAAKPVSLRSP